MESNARKNSEQNIENGIPPSYWTKSLRLNEQYVITLHVQEFHNWILAFAYHEKPLVGSLAIVAPGQIGSVPLSSPIGQGIQFPLAHALAEVISGRTGKVTLSSINLTEDSSMFSQILHDLINAFLKDRMKSQEQAANNSSNQ